MISDGHDISLDHIRRSQSQSSSLHPAGSATGRKRKRLVRLVAQAQLLADELGMDRDVTANLALAKMNATPLIDASGESPNEKGQR